MGRVKFEVKYAELHYSKYRESCRRLRYRLRPKKELLPISVVENMLGWGPAEIANYEKFLILEFVDGIWVYPVDVWKVLGRRYRSRLGCLDW